MFCVFNFLFPLFGLRQYGRRKNVATILCYCIAIHINTKSKNVNVSTYIFITTCIHLEFIGSFPLRPPPHTVDRTELFQNEEKCTFNKCITATAADASIIYT